MQPKSTVLPILFVLILHMILLLPALGQQSYTWNVVGEGDWETSGNWFPPGIPAYGDTVFIPADTVQIHIDLSVSVLSLSGGAVLRGPGTLTVSDSLFWGYGDMTGSGTTVIAAGAVARVDHGSDNIDLNERVLENYGLLYWLGSGTWKLKNQAQIINHPGAVFDIRRDGVLDYVLDLNGGSFVNHGLLKKTAGSDRLEFDATFTNSPGGTAQSSSGTLRFERGSATPSAGNFIADAGALIQIAERPFQVDGAVFNGAGVVEVVDRANFEVLGSGAAVGDSLTLRMNTDDQGGNGFIQGDGPLTVDGSFEWTRGTVRGSGDLNINGTLQTAAGGTRILEAKTLNNYGNINLNETIRLSGSALLVNQAGGTVAIENGSDIREETPGGQIRNAGTFLRSSAPGISLIQIDFINRGVLEITEGTLAFENALTNSAAGVIQGSDTIKVQGAAFTNSGTVRPGTSPGSLILIGNFSQDAGSNFDVEIGGNTPGSSYDQLMVSGSAQLDGTLNISLVNGFEPVAGQTFSIMNYGSHSGQFAAVNNAVLNGNSVFAVEYLGSELRLTAGSFDRFILTALDDGNGSVVIDPPGGEYDAGAVVTLTAQPAAGRYFTHWSGDIDSSANPLTVTVDSNITVTAHFNELPDFTVTAIAGPGGSVMLDPPGGVYDSSTVVTLTAQPTPGYRFSGWSGDLNSLANPDSMYIDGNKTVSASFSPLPVYALNVDTAGNGSVTLDPPGGSYDSSTVVTLTAQPDSGYRFSGWSGDLSGTANPASIVMDSSQQITATFIALPVFALTLDTLGAGGISADPPGGSYDSSATVTLTALPDSGYIFTGWSGDLSGNANPDSIVMNSDKSVSASFLARFALSADTIGTGTVVLSPAGGIYDSAQTVTLVALPASGYYFDGWSGDLSGSANPAYLLMDGDKQLTARFRKLARFSLTVDTLGAGGVSWAPPGSVYDSASVVTLTAAPDSGYYFQGWSGDLSGNDNPLQMLMDANKSVAANFAELPDFTLTLDTIGGGGVALDPPGGIYDSTTIVTLTALPDSGYVFGGWSGDLGGSANPATLLLDADKNVTAIFIAQFQLVIDTVGAGAITATPDTSGRIYDSLTVVTLSAAPAPGYYLSGWSGDLSGRDNPAVIIMNANKTVTGTFQQLPDFNLSTTVNGAGNITLNPPGGVYDSTTVVTLTATADSGYAFTGWSGDLSGLANPDSLLIDGHKSVTANFSPLQVLFTLTVDTSGSGSVQLNPPGGAYDSATVVTLTALPDSGFYFDGWSGDLSGPANPDSLVMDSSKSVTATFRELPDFVLTVTDSGPGTIVLDPPGGIYDSTTTVTVTAVPEYGATFLGWGGDLSGSTNPSTVIMDGNKQISAGFYKAPAYYTWNSGAGDWEDPTKWSPNGIPGPGDTAQVKNVQVTLNSDREVSVLILRAGGALGGGTTLTIRDSLQWTSGDMVDSGRTVIDTACIARISHGDNTIDLNLRTLENKGEVIWEGTGVWKLKNQANIYNRPGAVFDIRRDGILDFVKDLNGGNFINEGLLKKTAGTERVEFDPEFTNLAGGVVRASSGTLRFERGDATPSQGHFYADSGAVLQISERPFYADSVLFSGTGLFNLVDLVTLNVIGGGLVVDSFATLQLNTANLGSDGFLQGDGPLTVNGTFDWTLGTIQGGGDLLINGTLVTGTGGTRVLDGRTLTINGQAYQTETIRLSGSAVLLNQAGARYELGGDVNIEISGGGSFSNAGTFAKITTAGISRVEADFENDGIVDVQSGTLGFDGAFTNQAGALVQGSGTLDLSGAGFSNDGIFSPGASPGILSVSGNYYQSAAAQLQVEVAGDSAGTAYDRLQVSGNATLDGDLTVSLDGGYLPLLGQQFSILTGANRSGSFASVQLPQHDGNDIFSLSYTDSSVILTAIYVPAFQLTVETAGGGSVSLNPPGGAYDSRAVVTLTALPDPGYVFIRWEGDLSGSANPDSLVMDGDKTVTAVFEQKFALDVQTSGSGSVALNPAGGIYDSATVVTLSATPDSGYAFNGWSGDLSGNANPDSIVMDGNKNVTASFIARYALNLTTIGHGTVTVSPDTSGGIYDSATVVTLVATPDPGYAFSGWSGDLSGAASPDSLVMDGDKNVTATFRVQFDLTVSSSGNGAVALDPPGGVYDSSTVVTLSALPDSGYAFTGWSGDLSGNANPDSVVMDSNKAVTANFALLSTLQFNLSVTASAGGSVILDPPGSLHNGGTTVILSAVPDSGYTFGGWSGDLSGSANPDSIYLDGDKQVAAIFLPRYTLSTSIFGDGTITLDPPGGVYDSAAVVTLTATPGSGYSFEKWLGDLSGSDTTVQLTMNSNKDVSASFVLYQLGEIQHLGTVSGGSSGSTTVATSANVSAAEGDLYLAAISSKSQEPVLTVSGMGLSWMLKEDQCAGRSNTGVEIWWAQGTPSGDGIVSATFGSAPTSAVITVSRYTGVHPTAPLGASVAGNTLGIDGSCSGGTDSDNYNFSLSTSVADAYVFSAAAIRNRSHTPGSGYSEIGEYSQGSGGDMAALALQHKPQPTVGSTAVDGTLSNATDWAVVGIEIVPGSGAPRYTLSTATVGSGSITVDPSGSIFDSSAVVTLTALPGPGYTFTGWSGDLSGTLNPQTLTMDFHKSVTATFAQNQPLLADVKVYLQGFYSEADSAMHTGLRDSSLLPLAQPFSSAPWLYSGTEQVDSIPSGVVDWVLVKLRTSPAAGDEVAVRSGFLHRDGHIYDLDGISPLAFPGLPPGGYYLVVDHRNHLAVMSSTAHALDFVANLYDFSTAQGQAYGPDPLVVLPGGRLAMPAGDANGDNAVDTADKLSYWRNQNGTFWTYDKLSDFNGDGSIDAADLNRYWRPNDGKTSQVPAAQPGVQTKPVNRAAQW